MEKIKDFLYDLSDIFLSLIIVALIFSVVTWKISDIMKTPSISVAESDNSYMTADNTTDKYDNKIEVITFDTDENGTSSESSTETGSSDNSSTDSNSATDTASNGNADGQSTDSTKTESASSSTDSSKTQTSSTSTSTSSSSSSTSSSSDGKPAASKKTYTVTVEIPKGATGYKISKILKSNGLISDTQEFIALATKIELVDKMRSGTYELSSDMTMEQMIKKLSGK